MEIKKVETSFNDKIFWKENNISFTDKFKNQEFKLINIYPEVTYQEVLGFGGAFTESSGYNLTIVNDEIRENILNDYFSKDGLNYSFCRTPIGSTDFSLKSYCYLNNKDINSFDISQDEKYIIPMINKALKINNNITLLASPWSPPSFMKNTKLPILGGKLKEKYYDLYAKYLSKYILKYNEKGIKISYLTIQNEPNATQLWESCRYTPEEELSFAKILYNEFKNSNIDTKIICYDHNKEKLFNRANYIYSNDNDNIISGMGIHWYSGDYFEELKLTKDKYPNKLLIHTEGCTGFSGFNPNDEIKNAEMYAHDILNDLNNGVNSYIDWNLVLDSKGGPNHKKNYCNSPIMLKEDLSDYIKNLTYYYIGHFSKYITPKSMRIGYSKFSDKLEVLATKNENNDIVVQILNRFNESIEYNINLFNNLLKDNIKSHSIITYIFKN